MNKTIESHIPCRLCGSSDAATVYEDDKGKLFAMCFSCRQSEQLEAYHEAETVEKVSSNEASAMPGLPAAIPSRGITKDTCVRYGVTVDGGQVNFPYVGGYKSRLLTEKKFWQTGTPSGLFGQDKFPGNGKYVTLVEGEMDALAAYQMLSGKGVVVSIRRGAGSAFKDCQEAYEWLDSFEKVKVCFDNDAVGQEAARKVMELFSHKAMLVRLSRHKDANDYLMNEDAKDFVDAWWKAEPYVPDGIIQGATLWDTINQPHTAADVLYPFGKLNALTYGIRKGELVMVTAGSGLGKSQFLREIAWQILCKTKDNIGCLFLEESTEKTAVGMMSLAANKPLYLPDVEYTDDEYRQAFDATLGTGRVYLYDHFGSSAIDTLVARVRHMARGLQCGYVILDHISIVVSNQESDERKALDEVMTKLRTLVQETGIALICVSHLKRPEGKGHEEGAAVSLAQLRGSGAIAQLSDIVIGLERNGQAEDMRERNTTRIRVLKNRFCGLTGPAGQALYSLETGRMLEDDNEETI